MTARNRVAIAALAVAGLLAAVGIGLLANSVASDSIGLAASPLRAGEYESDTLAPRAAKGRSHGRSRAKHRPSRGSRARARTTSTPASTGGAGDEGTAIEDRSGSSGSGDSGSSGGGSDSSGSSGSGSGSSGSGSSGDD